MELLLLLGLCCGIPVLCLLSVMLLFSVKILAVVGLFTIKHYAALKMSYKVIKYVREIVTVDDTKRLYNAIIVKDDSDVS